MFGPADPSSLSDDHDGVYLDALALYQPPRNTSLPFTPRRTSQADIAKFVQAWRSSTGVDVLFNYGNLTNGFLQTAIGVSVLSAAYFHQLIE